MSHFHSNALLGASGNQGYEIQRSLRFNAGDGGFLHRTPSGAGNQKKYTISLWVKRTAFLASALDVSFLGAGDGTTYGISGTGAFGASLNGHVFMRNGGANVGYWDIEFRDPSAWYHFVLAIDTDQSTAANRNRLYVNGVDQGAPSANFGSGASTNINAASIHSIGTFNLPSSLSPFAGYFTNGYLAEYNFVDGSQLGPGSFGETDPVTGAWIPKKYVGTYGTNGFYLNFSDNSGVTATTLGKDSSGNGNNWTPNNFSVTAGTGNDSLEDTPTNNWCTFNPLQKGTITASEGNLKAVGGADYQAIHGTIGLPSSGKFYWEATVNSTSGAVTDQFVGVAGNDTALSGTSPYPQSDTPVLYYIGTGTLTKNGSSVQTGLGAFSADDVIGVAYDADASTVQFYKNGSAVGTAESLPSTTETLFPAYIATTNRFANFNWGQRSFDQTPPTGFKALNTANLPVPTIKNGTEYFNTVLWTGNSAVQAITGVGFQPDFVWGKARSVGYANNLFDVVRGATQSLVSNSTAAEITLTGLTSFDSDGFTLGSNLDLNLTTHTYVAWNWKAGGIPTVPTQGTISSTASVNTEAGFSIVEYTGNSTAGATVGHGLGVAPKMIITKTTSTNLGNWGVYHYGVDPTSPEDYMLNLNLGNGRTNSALWWNDTAPTSTVFTVGTSNDVNGSSDYIAYCFAEIEGYSKFGSYEGNGSTNGTYIYTGFSPAFFLLKDIDRSNTRWILIDSARDPHNYAYHVLSPSGAQAEDASESYWLLDFVSNGVKLRYGADNEFNRSGDTYIYMAFAENPFKYANAR